MTLAVMQQHHISTLTQVVVSTLSCIVILLLLDSSVFPGTCQGFRKPADLRQMYWHRGGTAFKVEAAEFCPCSGDLLLGLLQPR